MVSVQLLLEFLEYLNYDQLFEFIIFPVPILN